MDTQDNDRVRTQVRTAYAKVAQGAGGCSVGCCGTEGAGSLTLGYTPEDLASVPEGADLERLKTHSRGKDDKWRLKKHLVPYLGKMTLQEITVARVKGLLKHMRDNSAGKTTMRACVRLLGRFLTEQADAGLIAFNPVSRLDRHTRRLFRPDHDPRETPFLRTKDEIRTLYLRPSPGCGHSVEDRRRCWILHQELRRIGRARH